MVSNWHVIGKIRSSSYRIKIINALQERELTPKELEKKTNIKASHISRTLRELEQMELIICLTPQLKKNKLFQLTNKGEEIANALREN